MMRKIYALFYTSYMGMSENAAVYSIPQHMAIHIHGEDHYSP